MCEDEYYKKLINNRLKNNKIVAYIDEVGTGAIFGDVVVGCVVLKDDFFDERVNDSKKVRPNTRKILANIILNNVRYYSFGISNVDEINKIKNIWEADRLAMLRAVLNLGVMPDVLFVDGPNHKLHLPIETHYVKKGDSKVFGISASSIIAKVYRDNYIVKNFSMNFPKYDLESNKGYRSPNHLMAIRKYGITKYHRSYMKQIKKVLDGKYDEVIETKYKERYKEI
jgi:ribonuclease HII